MKKPGGGNRPAGADKPLNKLMGLYTMYQKKSRREVKKVSTYERKLYRDGVKSRRAKYQALVEMASDPDYIRAAEKCKPKTDLQQAAAEIAESWRGRK